MPGQLGQAQAAQQDQDSLRGAQCRFLWGTREAGLALHKHFSIKNQNFKLSSQFPANSTLLPESRTTTFEILSLTNLLQSLTAHLYTVNSITGF